MFLFNLRPGLFLFAALGAALAGTIFFSNSATTSAQEDPVPKGDRALDSGIRGDIVGSPSCSAVSCHGGIEPRDNPACGQNEFSLWSTRDPHANAMNVLSDERSLKMGKLLGITPNENLACLACHTNPRAALTPPEESKKTLFATERRWGVGCESCHGPAEKWLLNHTKSAWRDFSPAEKSRQDMVPLEDLAAQFHNCAGCHVGAPARDGLPLRDVTHDMIAAGHPRLQFEPSTFLANLPPHWNVARASRKNRFEGQSWVLGQLAAASASLELTLDRADRPASWPELAEFSCYACHHDLENESWRQRRDENPAHKKSMRPGAVPWSGWYWSGPLLLSQCEPFDAPAFQATLDQFSSRISLPGGATSRDWIPQADVLNKNLDRMLEQAKRPWSRERSHALLRQFGAKGIPASAAGDWDEAEQLFLGCLALNQDARIKALDALLWNKLEDVRGFPPKVDSPRGFRPDSFFPMLEKALRGEK